MKNEWTDAHEREALRRTYELAAELVGEGREEDAQTLTEVAHVDAISSSLDLKETLDHIGLDPARIDREVRRVRALAEGRLVRDVRWRARSEEGEEAFYLHRSGAVAWLSADGAIKGTVARVTRIRKAAP